MLAWAVGATPPPSRSISCSAAGIELISSRAQPQPEDRRVPSRREPAASDCPKLVEFNYQ